MIGTVPEMRALNFDLSASVWTLGVIGALFESGLATHLREPQSVDDLAARCPGLSRGRIERCLAVAAAAGVVAAEGARYLLAEGAMPFTQQPMRVSLQGEIRCALMQALALVDSSSGANPKAWRDHTDRALLQAQGDASSAFPPMFKAKMIDAMGDLAARLERADARFLDVGVGVAGLAIAMCQTFPQLHVVGVDTLDAPLAIARENVARASLAERIDLRRLAVEDLREEESFDMAWLPSFFIPAPVLVAAAARVRAALRPGGWVFLATASSAAADPRQRAVFGLINELWGGPVLTADEAEALLKEAGFSSVRTVPGPGSAPALIVGQR